MKRGLVCQEKLASKMLVAIPMSSGVLNVFVSYAIVAQLTGKEMINIFTVLLLGRTPGAYTPPVPTPRCLDIIFDLGLK